MLAFLIILLFGSSANLSFACIECPVEERGKLRLGSGVADDDLLKTIAFEGKSGSGGKYLAQPPTRQLNYAGHFHPKAMVHRGGPPQTKSAMTSPNLFHIYSLLNKGALLPEPRVLVDDYTTAELRTPRISKKAGKGMMIDVIDYVSKGDDRNRRVGQSMRSSG